MPKEATIYDFLVLSLRSKDIIATFNWDPLLAQAFARNMEIVGYENMPKIVYLHGNVAIGVCNQCRTCGWQSNKCKKCKKSFSPSKLLYPISRKNYASDGFLSDQWQLLQQYLKNAYFITIFGYSAPVTDIEAKNLMLKVWRENEITDFSIIEIIDIKHRDKIKENWVDFIIRDNYGIFQNFFDIQQTFYPRRSCEALAMATLQQHPWKENRFPQKLSLKELQKWVYPLVEEEKRGRLTN